MHFRAALSLAVFGASALAEESTRARQNSCVMCPEVIPECPVCPEDQTCQYSNPSDCTECPSAFCADTSPSATPTLTGIIASSPTITTDGGFTLPTASESETVTLTGTVSPSATSTGASGSGSATATSASSASAPASSSSAPGSSAAGRNADVAGALWVALLMAVPVLGLQRLW